VHGDLEAFLNHKAPSIVCVAPCHPPVPSRSDAEHVETWEDVLETVVSAGSLVNEEQAANNSPPTMHDKMRDRRATSSG
jgi:hypothetical protein